MKRTPGDFSLTHSRTENPCAFAVRHIPALRRPSGHGANRIEHAAVVLIQERLRRSAAHQVAQLARVRHQQEPVEFIHVLTPAAMRLASDRGEERARIASPAAVLPFVIGDERSRQLLDVVDALDLREQVPLHGARVERIEHHVAARRVDRIAADSRRPDRRSPRDRRATSAGHDFPDRRALAGAGRADQLEVLGLILRRNRRAGQRDSRVACMPVMPRDRRRRAFGNQSASAVRLAVPFIARDRPCRPHSREPH